MKFEWTFPYPSKRMPVFAGNVIATSQPLAAQAGLSMLYRGGNAIDAALAAAIALTVVEPTGTGIGSDAFAIVWDGEKLHGLNGSGKSPRAWRPERFRNLKAMPERGWDSVTAPGAVAAWASLSERFGKLPFEALFEPACTYASAGFMVSPVTARRWKDLAPLFDGFSDFAEMYLPQGRPPEPGELFRYPFQAKALQEIAETRGKSFYRGRIAERIAAHAAAGGGALTIDDLSSHESEWVVPLSRKFRHVEIHELPPNGQGLVVLLALGILDHLDVRNHPVDSADSIHLQIEAIKIAFSETRRHIADPAFMRVRPEEFLTDGFAAPLARTISLGKTLSPTLSIPVDHGTVYITAADSEGRMISMIQSNFRGFGSGIIIPGTGISLQNRGSAFSLEPGHPNVVAGAKRPYHTIIPGFMTQNGSSLMSFGVMGAHMQPQGHVQMIVRIVDYGQNPQAASDAPRWFVDERFRVLLEPGFDHAVAEELSRRGHAVVTGASESNFGGAQMIYKLDNGFCAASDHRKDGQAVGF
ncbi:MAG: gamma-glutamyltransferase family protein [Deltaproteobacteria bacterium]|nr:gamma-glutamyltransferase family protein [Deltaproteobacteria bacterium]